MAAATPMTKQPPTRTPATELVVTAGLIATPVVAESTTNDEGTTMTRCEIVFDLEG